MNSTSHIRDRSLIYQEWSYGAQATGNSVANHLISCLLDGVKWEGRLSCTWQTAMQSPGSWRTS